MTPGNALLCVEFAPVFFLFLVVVVALVPPVAPWGDWYFLWLFVLVDVL